MPADTSMGDAEALYALQLLGSEHATEYRGILISRPMREG